MWPPDSQPFPIKIILESTVSKMGPFIKKKGLLTLEKMGQKLQCFLNKIFGKNSLFMLQNCNV